MRRALAVGLVALLVPTAAQATPTIRASIAPTTVHVGDPFRYTVVARVPGRAGASLRVVADSGAFVQISGPVVSRTSDPGGATVVAVTETLVCLDLGCVSGATARHVVLPAPQVFTGSTRAGGPHTTVTVTPRVTAHAVAAGRAAYLGDTSAPTLTPRLRLGVAAATAIVLALALLGAAVALVLAEVRRKAPEPNVRRSPFDLGIAVRLLRESAKRPEPDRRRAADLVARLASPEVVDEATRVAWARPAPGPADVESLAADVERTSGTTHR